MKPKDKTLVQPAPRAKSKTTAFFKYAMQADSGYRAQGEGIRVTVEQYAAIMEILTSPDDWVGRIRAVVGPLTPLDTPRLGDDALCARRYRHLRATTKAVSDVSGCRISVESANQFDEAVDKAIRASSHDAVAIEE